LGKMGGGINSLKECQAQTQERGGEGKDKSEKAKKKKKRNKEFGKGIPRTINVGKMAAGERGKEESRNGGCSSAEKEIRAHKKIPRPTGV